mgnify:CR=1 FL=1
MIELIEQLRGLQEGDGAAVGGKLNSGLLQCADGPGGPGGNVAVCCGGGTAFVAQCTAGSGGTWNGATESLKRRLSEVYVYADGSADAAALVREGAIPLTAAPRFLSELPPRELSIFD